jgi:S-DNA-T family DNA segregation ATPase FtsK/SpoIIIE
MTSRRTRRKRDLEASTAAKLLNERARDVEKQRKARRKQRRKMVRDLFTGVGGAVSFRYRKQLRPFYLLAALYLAGLGAVATGNPRGVVAAAILLGVPAVLFWLRGALQRRAEQAYALCCCAAAVAWLGLAAGGLTGHRIVDVAGVLAWAAGAALWLRAHRVRDVPEQPQPDGTLRELWEQRVACKGGALPDSKLGSETPVPNGIATTIALAPGSQSTEDAMAATRKVGSALQKPTGNVVIEPTPAGEHNLARMLVLRSNPLHDVQRWPGPQLDTATGLAPAGVYVDGVVGECRWFDEGGAKSWLVAGAPGSGKSRFLDATLATACHSGIWHTWLGDGQHGQSIPDWLDSPGIGWAATEDDEIWRMVFSALQVMHARSRHLGEIEWTDARGRHRKGLKNFDPQLSGMPYLQLVIDEAGLLLGRKPELIKPLKELAQAGRKNGIRLVLATQVPSVNELGGSIELRSFVSGNVICFKTNDRVSGGMAFAGGLDVDPSSLPTETPDGRPMSGVCYLLSPGSRPSMLRTYLVEDPYDWSSTAPRTPLHIVDENAVRIACEAIRLHEAGVTSEQYRTGSTAASSPDGSSPDTSQPYPFDAAEQPEESGTVVDAILALPWDQHPEQTRAQIIDGTGCGVSAVQKALRRLTDSGQLERAGHGYYRLVTRSVAA